MLAAALSVLASADACRTAQAGAYVNKEYGFSVEVPDGYKTCDHQGYQHDTGVTILLDDSSPACHFSELHPIIEVRAYYNAAFEPDAEAFLGDGCHDDQGQLLPAPSGLAFRHSHTARCQRHYEGGWTRVFVVTHAWEQGEGFGDDSTKPMIFYLAHLSTSMSRLADDLERFRSVMETIQIFTPE
jgi:hypothetical protein